MVFGFSKQQRQILQDTEDLSALEYEKLLASTVENNADRFDAYGNNVLSILLRDEERAYMSPEQQVARLMAAGMSRAAALEAVNSAGGGSGSGITPQMAGNAEMAEAEKLNAISNTISAVGNTLGNLAKDIAGIVMAVPQYQMQQQLSLVYPQLVQNQLAQDTARTRVLQNEASISDMNFTALQGLGEFEQVMLNYSNNHDGYERPASFADWLTWASRLNIESEDITEAQVAHYYNKYSDMFKKNPALYQMLQMQYGQDYAERYSNSVARNLAVAKQTLSGIDIEKGVSELHEINQRVINMVKEGKYTDEQIKVAQATYLHILKECNFIDANTYKTMQEEQSLWLDSLLKDQELELNSAEFGVRIRSAENKLYELSCLPSEVFENNAKKALLDSRSGVALAYVGAITSLDQANLISGKYGNTLRLQSALNSLGLLDYNTTSWGLPWNILNVKANEFGNIDIVPHSFSGGNSIGKGATRVNSSQEDMWQKFKNMK